jgi:cytochrome c-type biogenesis protein CcmF
VTHNFLSALTHPFVPEGILSLFVICQVAICLQSKQNRPWLHQAGVISLCVLFAYALYAHVCVDTRYFHVMYNNHVAQALHYRIASLWSHHETSLFVWLCMLNLTTYIIRVPADITHFRRQVLALFNCFFCFYMMTEANPFASTPLDLLNQPTQGLNPLLYDLNMVWHPPLLYLGVTWLFTTYVLALWQHRTGDYLIIPLIQQQTKIAFGVLTLAIALGSFWAFTQLGWGGFWFWDPVETASLLPWVAALIVFHVAPCTLKRYPVIAGIPFAVVMISLWAVRSGMLMSVHSFANDVMAFWVLGGIAVFAFMPVVMMLFGQRRLEVTGYTQTYLNYGMWLLAAALALLLLGLFVPVIFDFSLSPVFFNTTLLPITVLIAMFMAIAPFRKMKANISITCALVAVIFYLVYYAFYVTLAIPYLILGASGAAVSAAMLPLLRQKPRVALAHMGVGLCLIGLASYSNSPPESMLTLEKDKEFRILSRNIEFPIIFKGLSEVSEPFLSIQSARIEIRREEGSNTPSLTLTPARQFFHSSQLQRVKASFGVLRSRVFIISNIEMLDNGRVAVTLHEKYGLLWLVLGCVLIIAALLIVPVFRIFLQKSIDLKVILN